VVNIRSKLVSENSGNNIIKLNVQLSP
jgi:hypothetical protein